MKLKTTSHRPSRHAMKRVEAQKGVVLIVALIMVLLMTVVALSSIRGSGLQEAMAGNLRDRNIALQSCEAGIREGENIVDIKVKTLPAFNGTNGLFLDLNKSPASSVLNFSNTIWKGTGQKSAISLPAVAQPPYYVVEEVQINRTLCAAQDGNSVNSDAPMNCGTPYRISCMGVGMSTDASVVAQSIYKRPE